MRLWVKAPFLPIGVSFGGRRRCGRRMNPTLWFALLLPLLVFSMYGFGWLLGLLKVLGVIAAFVVLVWGAAVLIDRWTERPESPAPSREQPKDRPYPWRPGY